MARITIISQDPKVQSTAIQTLDGRHDVGAISPGAFLGGLSGPLGDDPDVVVVDAQHLGGLKASLRQPVIQSDDACWLPGAGDSGTAVRTQAPKVLVLLAPGEEGRILECFDAGANDYLFKPFDPATFKAKVDGLLAQRLGILDGDTVTVNPIAVSDDGRLLRKGTEDDDDIQAQLGRYEVQGILGRGGYGVVYRAHDVALGRDVALKVLPKHLNDNAEAVARFFRESSAIGRLDHPNIVKFYEVGSYQDRLYFTMELVEGVTLKSIADKQAPLPPRRAAHYVAGIAEALGAIESLGLVHRDVKPENVIITPWDQVKLIDFGLVRMQNTAAITSEDDVLGTPYFMCPEYIRAPGIPDIRYDLYALGVTFFHLLCGEYPFDGKNAAHVMAKHLRCRAPRVSVYQPGIPPLADEVIDRLLEKDPDRRLQTPQQVLAMMRPLLDAA
jgi:CheY-like chemotaxis protein